MQIFLIIIHVIACLFLIAVILLQAGRGGGLSDIAGGSQAQSILGTETNTFMKRMTEIFAVIFIITSLSLGIISTHRGKSLIQQRRIAQNFKKTIPKPAEAPVAPDGTKAVVPASATAVALPTPAATSATPAAAAAEAKTPVEGNAK